MSKDKLKSIRNLYRAQERALGQDLQRTAKERDQHRAQERELRSLLAQYRDEHVQSATWSAEQVMRFQRFYRQLVTTLSAQDALTRRLAEAERLQREAWRSAYQRRLGLEKVIDKQAAEASMVARRRERREAKPPRQDAWSRLNESAKETDL